MKILIKAVLISMILISYQVKAQDVPCSLLCENASEHQQMFYDLLYQRVYLDYVASNYDQRTLDKLIKEIRNVSFLDSKEKAFTGGKRAINVVSSIEGYDYEAREIELVVGYLKYSSSTCLRCIRQSK